MLDWARVQPALTRADYPCGRIDGQPGPLTWTALFAYAAGRAADSTLGAIGKSAAACLTEDAIAATPQRLAEFVAQTAHETGGYRVFEEQLGYTAAQLLDLWPARFTPIRAHACAGRPMDIACWAYGGRNGNAPWPSEDGWRYRGRGMLQLTGRANYALYGPLVDLPLVEEPDLAADPGDSLVIAREFWQRAGVNAHVDRGDFIGARRATNGGTVGLADVAVRRARMLQILY